MTARLRNLFKNPKLRLGARAVAAGAVYAFSHLHGHTVDHTLLVTVLVGAGWAALEVVTPLNGILGIFKQAVKIDPAVKKWEPPAAPPAA